MLRANDLAVRRGSRTVLAGIDVQLHPGRVLGVLGPNGAGKSTLLAALCDELAASEGTVSLDGQKLSDWPGQERARRLAVLPQSSSLNFAFSVNEVVAMGRLPMPVAGCAMRKSSPRRSAPPTPCTWPDAVIWPCPGVSASACTWRGCSRNCGRAPRGRPCCSMNRRQCFDPLHQHTTLQAVRDFAGRGAAVLVILHDLNLAARYCDHLLLLQDGRPHAYGPPDEVLTAEALEAVYGLQVLIQRHPERGHPLIIAR